MLTGGVQGLTAGPGSSNLGPLPSFTASALEAHNPSNGIVIMELSIQPDTTTQGRQNPEINQNLKGKNTVNWNMQSI